MISVTIGKADVNNEDVSIVDDYLAGVKFKLLESDDELLRNRGEITPSGVVERYRGAFDPVATKKQFMQSHAYKLLKSDDIDLMINPVAVFVVSPTD